MIEVLLMDNAAENKAETVLGTESSPAAALPAKEVKEEKPVSTLAGSFYDAVSILITAIMIIAIVFTFAFRLVGVNGSSMHNTLQDGDWLFVRPYYSAPQYGDIVISTKETAAEGSIVKRVIAVAGDEVVVDETDTVYVNGVKLEEDSYTIKNGRQHGNLIYPITVPEGCVMVMGDNRPGSWDSRFREIGFQEVDFLLGKAEFRLGKNYNIYSNFNQ